MRTFPQPQVVVSKCLGFAACRYNAVTIPDDFVQQLRPYVTFLPVCPEVEIGLGAPREPIRIVLEGDALRLVQPATGLDVTERMHEFAAQHCAALGSVDGFILKGRSPSCGIKEVKRHRGIARGAASDNKGVGLFAAAVLERFAHLPVEEEGRLSNFIIREHFLTRLFTLADFRAIKAAATIKELVRFHSDNKLLLLAYNESRMRLMGPLVANRDKKPPAEIIAAYEPHLWAALAHPPRRTAGINVLMHALGYFSEQLSAQEKAYFLDALEKYRAQRAPLSVPVSLLGAWIARFDESYLARQTFFEPYPPALVTISDSGKGRDLR